MEKYATVEQGTRSARAAASATRPNGQDNNKQARQPSMFHWHLLMTKPREDERAEQHLLNQGYEIFRPRLRALKLRRGRQVAVEESLFPRYIFIRLDDAFSNWSALRSTRGIAHLVRFAEYPALVPDALVDALKAQADADGVIDRIHANPYLYKAGDRVEITEGSFKGLQAIVKAQNSEERVVILLSLLGGQHAITVPVATLKTL